MTTKPKGFRRDITLLHHLSDLMEKHPTLDRPEVRLATDDKGDAQNQVTWHLSPDYKLRIEHLDEDGNWRDWYERDRLLKEIRRANLEERIAALVLALGEDVEWTKNDPSTPTGSYSYTLTTTWHGAKMTISTWRDAVCEQVVVMETQREEEQPDPELAEKALAEIPKVKVTVTDKITEWQCNERIAAVTAPKHVRTVQAAS